MRRLWQRAGKRRARSRTLRPPRGRHRPTPSRVHRRLEHGRSARRTPRRASCSCDRPARRRACSDAPGATTTPASGSLTDAAASSWSPALLRRPPQQATQPEPRKPTERIETWGEFDPGDGFLVGRSSAGELSISRRAGAVPQSDAGLTDVHRSLGERAHGRRAKTTCSRTGSSCSSRAGSAHRS